MKPDPTLITLQDNVSRIKEMLMELILRPRRDLVKWAEITKQTANMKIGYTGQHLASLVTGVEGARTGARGHDLRDKSEVKSCSRVDQLDKCKECKAAVARIESECPECGARNIQRNNDSKWLLAVRSDTELEFLLTEVPRVVLILSDYPNFDDDDWETLQFQVFEIWPGQKRHIHFRTLMGNYFHNIYVPHIKENPRRTPAPKNFWPYSFQFYMCNPIRTLHCVVSEALRTPQIDVLEYIEPATDRAIVDAVPMPVSCLTNAERQVLRRRIGQESYADAEATGLNEKHRTLLELRDTDHASPQTRSYRRGVR